MSYLDDKFANLGCDNAPGQEVRQNAAALELRGEKLDGVPVDFSHGDVDAHIPTPGALGAFVDGVERGGSQAYTEYRGAKAIRDDLARKLEGHTGAPVDADNGLILTPGTQGALFLAMGALVGQGDKVAIVEPDYFANRKLVTFFGGEIVPVQLDYYKSDDCAGLDLASLEQAFADGARLFIFSNPNNPTGAIYSADEIASIARLAKQYGAALIVDELYSRQIFDGRPYTHLRALPERPDDLITIIGPSKTESLSGYRLGAAFGTPHLVQRMEKLQAIVSLRCAGYCQSVFQLWFSEPEGFMEERIAAHQRIRDDILALIAEQPGMRARSTNGGSYLFVDMPPLTVPIGDFVKIVRVLANVTVTPGTEFGPQFTNSFRINFSQDHQKAVDAMARLIEVMNRYRK